MIGDAENESAWGRLRASNGTIVRSQKITSTVKESCPISRELN
jgi:hypothetical protein